MDLIVDLMDYTMDCLWTKVWTYGPHNIHLWTGWWTLWTILWTVYGLISGLIMD